MNDGGRYSIKSPILSNPPPTRPTLSPPFTRWKDGRNTALRGDDIVGVAHDPEGKIQFLKGESKSRVALSASTINEASEALDRDMGQPNRHAILFIANRLREQGKDDLATELGKASFFAICQIRALVLWTKVILTTLPKPESTEGHRWTA